MSKIIVYINTGFAGATHRDEEELPDEWNDMSRDEQEAYLEEVAHDYLGNKIDFGAYVED